MQYMPPFGESHLATSMGSQQPSYNHNPAFQVSPGAVSCQDFIVGEGEVLTVVNPDGSGSFFFIPTTLRWSPDLCNGSGCFRNFCPNKNFTSGIWLVTSVTNPVPVQVFSQVLQKRGCVPPPVRQFVSDVTLHSVPTTSCSNTPFPLKFHNDGCTSTTDLHYFFPALRCREWIPHLGACVQVDLPPKERNIYHYEYVTKATGSNSVSMRSYDNNSMENDSMNIDEDVSTLPETKDKFVFTVTDNGIQTRTAISKPTQMICDRDACVDMHSCNLEYETKTPLVSGFMSPVKINSTYEQRPHCSCNNCVPVEDIMTEANGILTFQELHTQTDAKRQSKPTETFCTCSNEVCECRLDGCNVNDKLIATFQNSDIQTDPKTHSNTTQMCCCYNCNCETCDCIFNDAKNKDKLSSTFDETMAQTDVEKRPVTLEMFSLCKPETYDQSTDRSRTSLSYCESDSQTLSKEIQSISTETYACACEDCHCGEETEDDSGEDDERYCMCRTRYCCCNTGPSSPNKQTHEQEIRSSAYKLK